MNKNEIQLFMFELNQIHELNKIDPIAKNPILSSLSITTVLIVGYAKPSKIGNL